MQHELLDIDRTNEQNRFDCLKACASFDMFVDTVEQELQAKVRSIQDRTVHVDAPPGLIKAPTGAIYNAAA
eukprot:6441658-Alexandrium_andersonii.AAC.1